MQPKTLARKIAQFALSKKASHVVIMDLRRLTDMADYFVICSGDSDTQVKAIADAVEENTASIGTNVWRREGLTQRQWVLLDYVDVVMHIFHKEVRKVYNLEKLWGDAKTEVIEDVPAGKVRKPKPPIKTHPKRVAKVHS